eukprot:CAMPEP_0197854174 /NCGR_PEP_ID=MMETSP1438-20131217/24159_1 /TAXON_ID=1461541 /ORGANISM="Pterosperma sp., Strain CCMP1384" /LENGTH=128 /DNA_ID=CAMNT_0043468821 /DNA_START=53 /DNA_END=439 /DNA_ORIENTATION=+
MPLHSFTVSYANGLKLCEVIAHEQIVKRVGEVAGKTYLLTAVLPIQGTVLHSPCASAPGCPELPPWSEHKAWDPRPSELRIAAQEFLDLRKLCILIPELLTPPADGAHYVRVLWPLRIGSRRLVPSVD